MPEKFYYFDCYEHHTTDPTLDLFESGMVPWIPESRVVETLAKANAHAERMGLSCRYFPIEAPAEVAAAIANS